MRLDGRKAVVTGAGRGIGRGIALCLAREGADLLLSDVNMESAEKVAGELQMMGKQAYSVRTDVSRTEDVKAMVQSALDRMGRIDILVNNAGVIRIADVVDLKEEDWDAVYDVNIRGMFLCCKYAAPHMMRQRSGKIVNISSIAGREGAARRGAYASSKWAVLGFTQVLSKELGRFNINVNAVCPGMIWTEMQEYLDEQRRRYGERLYKDVVSRTVLGRDQTPEDIGNAVVFLVSEEARNITGQALTVNSGGPIG